MLIIATPLGRVPFAFGAPILLYKNLHFSLQWPHSPQKYIKRTAFVISYLIEHIVEWPLHVRMWVADTIWVDLVFPLQILSLLISYQSSILLGLSTVLYSAIYRCDNLYALFASGVLDMDPMSLIERRWLRDWVAAYYFSPFSCAVGHIELVIELIYIECPFLLCLSYLCMTALAHFALLVGNWTAAELFTQHASISCCTYSLSFGLFFPLSIYFASVLAVVSRHVNTVGSQLLRPGY